ncbi:hypothetical protein M0802_000015 [Mischocyttarus mexicanus]|nr:hypothetical protein M0802_000015 [Mischocyttarus mexicanus]
MLIEQRYTEAPYTARRQSKITAAAGAASASACKAAAAVAPRRILGMVLPFRERETKFAFALEDDHTVESFHSGGLPRVVDWEGWLFDRWSTPKSRLNVRLSNDVGSGNSGGCDSGGGGGGSGAIIDVTAVVIVVLVSFDVVFLPDLTKLIFLMRLFALY